jgi:hypothetical protein
MAKSKAAKTKKATEPETPKVEKPEAKAEDVEAPKAEASKVEGPKKSKVVGPDGGFGVPSSEPLAKPEERRIRLVSLYRRPMDITLEHEVYCAALGRCVCSTRAVGRWKRVEKGSRAQALRETELRIPKSFTLRPGKKSEPLHEAAQRCTDVKIRLTRRPKHMKILPV